MRKLVVGLGNPGSKYDGTRHNIGFEAVDRLALGGVRATFSRKFDGLLAESEINFRRILLLKPETFMNLSGRSVRQAIQWAIDKDNILKLYHGAGVKTDCIFPPDLLGFDPSCHPYGFDQAKAKQMLSDAGYPTGFKSTLYTDTTDPDPKVAAAIQQDLASIGITVDVITQSFDTFLNTIETPHAAPMNYVGWFEDYPDPSDFIDTIFSCATAVKGGANASFYCNAAVDAQALAARGETDAAKRISEYQAIQKAILADAPAVPLISEDWYTIVTKRVGGFVIHPVWLYSLRDVYIKPGS